MDYKKFFFKALIYALASSGGFGILIFLLGDFGGNMIRILLTTLAIGGYSLSGLCSSALYERKQRKLFALIGMFVSIVGFLVTFIAIWEIVEIDTIWKPVIVLIIISFVSSQISLLLLLIPKTIQIKQILIATIVSVIIVGLMFINSVLNNFDEGELYYRLLGVFAILDLLGTIATPILNRIIDEEKLD